MNGCLCVGPPPWCFGPAGWRVLVPAGNRPFLCGQAGRRAGQPSEILQTAAASAGSWFLHHSLRWQGNLSSFWRSSSAGLFLNLMNQVQNLYVPRWTYISPFVSRLRLSTLRWTIRRMIGWWRTWILWTTMWRLFSTSPLIISSLSSGERVRHIYPHIHSLPSALVELCSRVCRVDLYLLDLHHVYIHTSKINVLLIGTIKVFPSLRYHFQSVLYKWIKFRMY